MAEYETIIYETDGNVATVTINRPDALNSFTRTMMEEFRDVWRKVAQDEAVHCVMLRAADGRAFSTGVDVKKSMEPGGSVVDTADPFNAADPGEYLGPKSNDCWKPVVCAVHGMAAGGAFYWLNEADIVICAEDATFFDPHVTYGMTSALEPIGAKYKMRFGDVLRMVLLGNDERISAQTALASGLVSEVLPPEKLFDRALELAHTIAAKPSAATQGSLKAIWQSLDMPRSVALATGLQYCLVGNPVGVPQVNRAALMADKAKKYEVR